MYEERLHHLLYHFAQGNKVSTKLKETPYKDKVAVRPDDALKLWSKHSTDDMMDAKQLRAFLAAYCSQQGAKVGLRGCNFFPFV